MGAVSNGKEEGQGGRGETRQETPGEVRAKTSVASAGSWRRHTDSGESRSRGSTAGRGDVREGGKPLAPHSEGPDAAKWLEGRASLDTRPATRCHVLGYAQSVALTVGWPRP